MEQSLAEQRVSSKQTPSEHRNITLSRHTACLAELATHLPRFAIINKS